MYKLNFSCDLDTRSESDIVYQQIISECKNVLNALHVLQTRRSASNCRVQFSSVHRQSLILSEGLYIRRLTGV